MSENGRSAFATLLRDLRKKKGLTLRELGGKADLDFTYLSKVENDAVDVPSLDALHRIARALEASAAEVDRLIATRDERSERPGQLRPQVSREVELLLRRIYSGGLTRRQLRDMLRAAEQRRTLSKR